VTFLKKEDTLLKRSTKSLERIAAASHCFGGCNSFVGDAGNGTVFCKLGGEIKPRAYVPPDKVCQLVHQEPVLADA
jgi:hypothetical protein